MADTNTSTTLQDVFFKQNTCLLFEEYYLNLNLLLRSSFCKLSGAWHPKSTQRITKTENEEEIWRITLSQLNLPPVVMQWLTSQQFLFTQPTETIYVLFTNDIDCPTIQTNIAKIDQGDKDGRQELNYQTKSFQQFCKLQTNNNRIEAQLKRSITRAQKRNAVFFFTSGFYLAPSSVADAGLGVFSLGFVPAGKLLFEFGGKKTSCEKLNAKSDSDRTKIESFACEANFFIDENNTIDLIVDPTNKNHVMEVKDMYQHPNAGPWINEPPFGFVSNVFLQAYTNFALPKETKSRYILNVISARTIHAHDELFLYYDENYSRKGHYIPGEACP